MPILPRLRPHDRIPCPGPIVSVEEATKYDVPTTEEGWKALERIKKIDFNDLSHEFGLTETGEWSLDKAKAGVLKFLDETPTYWIGWEDADEIRSLGELKRHYPTMRPVVIESLLRRSETMNIIAPPKAGKSWLALNIAMNVIGGGDLFGKFKCERGRVLIVDNELHPETICQRAKDVAFNLNVPHDRADALIDFISLRGRLVDISQLGEKLQYVRRRTYNVVILDSFYKFTAPTDLHSRGFDENSNSDMARVYTEIDALAEHLDSAIILIHHSSKGLQSGKSITDIGAGGGSQSRACDTHLTIREHEEKSIFRIDGVNRSFGPLEPFCARFKWPKWEETKHDPEMLKGATKKNPGGMRVGGAKASGDIEKKDRPLTKEEKRIEERGRVDEFFDTVVVTPMSQSDILAAGVGRRFFPWSKDRIKDLVKELLEKNKIRVVSEGSGPKAATYISTSKKCDLFQSEIKDLTSRSGDDEKLYDGYTADFSHEQEIEQQPTDETDGDE